MEVYLDISQPYEDSPGVILNNTESGDSRYYKHNGDGTITHFDYATFEDTFGACLFKVENVSDGQPIYAEEGDVIGVMLAACTVL